MERKETSKGYRPALEISTTLGTEVDEMQQQQLEFNHNTSRKVYCCCCIKQRRAVFWLNMYSCFDCLNLIGCLVMGVLFKYKYEKSITFAHIGYGNG